MSASNSSTTEDRAATPTADATLPQAAAVA